MRERCGGRAQQEPLTPANAIGPDNSELACAAIKSGGQAGAQSNLRRRAGKSLASRRVADNRDEGTRCSDDDFTKPKTAKKFRQSFFLLVFTGRGVFFFSMGTLVYVITNMRFVASGIHSSIDCICLDRWQALLLREFELDVRKLIQSGIFPLTKRHFRLIIRPALSEFIACGFLVRERCETFGRVFLT